MITSQNHLTFPTPILLKQPLMTKMLMSLECNLNMIEPEIVCQGGSSLNAHSHQSPDITNLPRPMLLVVIQWQKHWLYYTFVIDLIVTGTSLTVHEIITILTK